MTKKVEAKDLKSRALADEYKDKLSINEHGVITPEDDFYASTLEDQGLSLDELKKYQKHEAKVLPAVSLAGGEMAHDYFKENPETNEVSMKVQVGHDTQTHRFHREEASHHQVTIEKHGAGDKGELKKVRNYLDGLFTE